MPVDGVKVLSTWLSIFGLRVLIALKHKGVEYEYQEENLLSSKNQLLLESNPVHKKVPVLIHNGKPICESLLIVQYIDEAWPSSEKPPLLPNDPYDRAVARFWADYVDKKMYDVGPRIIPSPAGEQREEAKKDLIRCIKGMYQRDLPTSAGRTSDLWTWLSLPSFDGSKALRLLRLQYYNGVHLGDSLSFFWLLSVSVFPLVVAQQVKTVQEALEKIIGSPVPSAFP